MFLADPQQLIWSDEDLQRFIIAALKQYSIDSGFFCNTFSFAPDLNGIYSLPDDYCNYLAGWNSSGKEVTVSQNAMCLPLSEGVPRFMFCGLSSGGDYMLNPAPKNMQNLKITVSSDIYGELEDLEFGVFDDGQWGVSEYIAEYDFVGDAVYTRLGNIEEIKDYMPIVYYSMYLAYSGDYDFSNAEAAQNSLIRYKQRMAAYDSVKKDLHGTLNTQHFY
jgi:hypothetical protein